jgi:hypothetical protein
MIDSRHRRKFLFDNGFWDGLLKEMPEKEKADWKRAVFFSGSFFFSSRAIPGVESHKLPLLLPTGPEAEGDSITVQQVVHYLAPNELLNSPKVPVSDAEVSFDKRCSGCTRAFQDVGSLLQHW